MTDTPARLALVVGRVYRRLRSVDGGLSHGLLSALASVTKLGPIRLADLAQHEVVSAPSITRLVADLERQALVTRTTDPADGRAFLIEATTEGKEIIIQARSARVELMAELFGRLDEADTAAVLAALPALERMAED